MSLLASVVAGAVAAEEELAPLIMPSWAFAVIAAGIFLVLGLMVWSYRDVANRHSDRVKKAADSAHGAEHH